MTQSRLNEIFDGFQAYVLGGRRLDALRLKRLQEVFYNGVLVGLPVHLRTEEQLAQFMEEHLALALCALGPLDAGPPFLSVFRELAGLAPSPWVSVDHHARVVRIRAETESNRAALSVTTDPEERRRLTDRAHGLRSELRLTKEDNPVVSVSVWFGLLGRRRAPDRAWLAAQPRAQEWTRPWGMAEFWVRDQVTRACNGFNRMLAYWNEQLNDQVVLGNVPSDIVDRLVSPSPEPIQIHTRKQLILEFHTVPAADEPVRDPETDGWYKSAWENSGLQVFVGNQPYHHRKAETRFVFWTDDCALSDPGGSVYLPPKARVVCRVGDRECFIECSATGARGTRLTDVRPKISLCPDEATSIRRDHCGCGSRRCQERHILGQWNSLAERHVSLRDFILNAVKGPVAKAKNATVTLLPNNAKTGMYYPFLASGIAQPQGEAPIRHARCMVWQCDTPQCRPTRRRKPRKGATPDQIEHRNGCARNRLRLVEDEWFISWDIRYFTLRPYWGPSKNLQICSLTDEHLISHPFFSEVERLALSPGGSVREWFKTLRAREKQANVLFRLLPAHLIEHGTDWDLAEMADWLEASKGKFAYTTLRDGLHDLMDKKQSATERAAALWKRFEEFANHCPWNFLLVHGYGSDFTPSRPLLRYEQLNLIVHTAREGLPRLEFRAIMKKARKALEEALKNKTMKSGVIRPPKYLWTRDYERDPSGPDMHRPHGFHGQRVRGPYRED